MGEIKRRFSHHEGQPIMVLFRAIDGGAKGYVIHINDAWKFSEELNPDGFVACVTKAAQEAYEHLGMGGMATSPKMETRRLAEIAQVIQEGLDDLIKMPPPEKGERRKESTAGKVKVMHGGEEKEFEVTSGGKLDG